MSVIVESKGSSAGQLVSDWLDKVQKKPAPGPVAQKKGEATKLFELGLIDEEEVLKTYDWPNWQGVLQRVQEKQAAMAEAQAAQEGQPPA